ACMQEWQHKQRGCRAQRLWNRLGRRAVHRVSPVRTYVPGYITSEHPLAIMAAARTRRGRRALPGTCGGGSRSTAPPCGESEMTTILVVDDHASVRTLIKEYLSEHGYRVVSAGDGREALVAVQVERPDLILLDVM